MAVPGILGSCGRFKPARAYQVQSSVDPASTYQSVRSVLEEHQYRVIDQDDAALRIRVRTHVDENDDDRQSFILAQVTADGRVMLTPEGYLVHPDGTLHVKLIDELGALEQNIAARVGAPSAQPPAAPQGAQVSNTAQAPATELPRAWTEPAYDPKTWGPGDFTCLPVQVATADQASLRLRLSTGEDADVVLSIAYAPELCRSPAECKLPDGCPALGIGDSQKVSVLAQRISSEQVASQATLLKGDIPIVTLDLSKHGSIAQALTGPQPSGPQPSAPPAPPEGAPEP